MNRTDKLPLRVRAWRLLMTPVGRRVPVRKGKGAPHGIALFMVLISLALMSAVVSDFGYNELVRYKLAAHERDALKAQALAEGGFQMSRLLLTVQDSIQGVITQMAGMLPLPNLTIWNLIPLDSEIMKGMTDGQIQSAFGLDMEEALAKRNEEYSEMVGEKMEEFEFDSDGGTGEKPFLPPKGGFGAFDGNFTVDIKDEEQKAATLRGWDGPTVLTPAARFAYVQRLMAVFVPERYDFLFEERNSYGDRVDRQELIANLYDWIDANQDSTDSSATMNRWGSGAGGSEDGMYTGYRDRNARPKNAFFDTPGDIRRVHGWTDAHTTAFMDKISLYADPKTNLLSAPPESIEALVRLCAMDPFDYNLLNRQWMQETLAMWNQCKSMGPLAALAGEGAGCQLTAAGFKAFLEGTRGLITNPETCNDDNIGTTSNTFTVRVTATVGDVSRTATFVYRPKSEEYYFYSIR